MTFMLVLDSYLCFRLDFGCCLEIYKQLLSPSWYSALVFDQKINILVFLLDFDHNFDSDLDFA
jgi:hypothetical protein